MIGITPHLSRGWDGILNLKNPKKLFWIILGCVATVVAALSVLIVLHFNSAAKNQVDLLSVSQTETTLTNELLEIGERNLNRVTIKDALAEFVETNSTFRRNSLLFRLLARANEYDLIEILRISKDIGRNSHRSAIQTASIRRLATINPVHALGWIAEMPRIRRDSMLEGLFLEWSLMDLSDSVEGAKTLTGTDRRIALETILATRTEMSESAALDISRDLGLEEIALQSIGAAQTLKLLDDPRGAWEVLVNDSIDDSKQLDSLKLVASEWKRQEGFNVLLQAARLFPDEDDQSALSTVIEAAVGDDIESAFAFLRTLSGRERGELPVALTMVATRTDPDLAIEQIAYWSDDPVHVHMQKALATTWARTDPRSMLDQFEKLPQVTRVKAMEIAFTRLAYESPADAIEYLEATRKFLRFDGAMALIIAQQWSRTDPEAALEWSLSYTESESHLRGHLIHHIFRSFVGKDVNRAFELAQDLEEEYPSVRIHVTQPELDVVWELTRMGKIDDAIALLPQLDEHPRHFAIDELGQALVRAGDPYAAVELGIDTPSLNAPLVGPATYFSRIFDLWATRNPQQLFHSLQSFTSPMLRSMAAKELISLQETTPALTEDQVKLAQELLNKRPIAGNTLKQELEMRAKQGLIDLDELEVPDEWLE